MAINNQNQVSVSAVPINQWNNPATPTNYSMGTVNVGNNPMPVSKDLATFNQGMVKPVVSNYNMGGKVNDIINTHNNQVGTSSPTPQIGGTQNTNTTTSGTGEMTSYGTPFTAPEGAQLQSNGTYLYNGQYYSKDQLGTPENLAAIANTGLQQKKIDEALKTQLDNINRQFDQYKQQQQQLTTSGAAGAQNALLQSGAGSRGTVAQYAATTADARVNTIVADGNKKLQDLDNQRQQLLSAAQLAKTDKDFELLGKLNAEISKNVASQIATVKEANMKLAAETKQSEIDREIANLYSQGTTDVGTLMNQLQSKGYNVSAKIIQDTIKNITPSGLDDLVKTMRINNAPNDLIQQTINEGITKGVGSAYTKAGKYGAGGTGIIGEYNYAIANGWKGTGDESDWFNQFQTADANRKAQLTNGAGLSTQQNASFLRITDNFQKDELIKNTYKGISAIEIADQIIANPNSATNQLKSLYALVKNLDPDSAVREGEITLANQTQSYLQKWGTDLTRIFNGQVISPDTAKSLAVATKDLVKTWNESAKSREKQYKAQAKGAGIEDAFNEYISSSSVPYATADKLIKDTKKLESDFDSLMIKDRENTTKAYQTLWQQLGHKPTAEEFFQWNPDLVVEGNQSFNTVVGDTNPAKGIISGVDITKYATDPQHEVKVANYFNEAPKNADPLDYDKYIKSLAPKSPVTGDMIITASSTYGVDPRLVLAIIRNDSTFGTKGKAVYTNNPGNVGNDDEGNIKKFKSVNDGVIAVAQWLANHKTNKYA